MASSVRDAALTYREWAFVLPLKPCEKRPSIAGWPDNATDEPSVIDAWYDAEVDGGVGLLMGQTPDGRFLFAVDSDEHDPQRSGSHSLAKLERQHGSLPPTVETTTPTGGRHLFFYSPQPISKSAGRLGPGIDIQGLGSFVVAPPSIHPNGGQYQFRPGHELGNHPIAEAPQWLIDLLATPILIPPSSTASVGEDFWKEFSDSPADRFNTQVTWDELLTEAGFTPHHRDRAGECHWTRPGKDRSEGSSLTTGYQGLDICHVFTSSIPWLPEGTYSKFKFAAHLRHGGDMSAMAKDVVAKEQRAIPTSDTTAPWDVPEPLVPVVEAQPFPVEALPQWMKEQIDTISYDLQVDRALPACLGLGALATVTIGNLTVFLPHGNWKQPTNLYLAVAMDPSAGKSPAKAAMFDAVVDIERVRMTMQQAAVMKQETIHAIFDKKIKILQDKMSKSSGDDYRAAEVELMDLIDEKNSAEPVADGRMIVDDTTSEALAKVMKSAGGSIAQVSAEGGLFERVLGVYNDGQANLDLHLEAWSGGRFQQDRITRDPIVIPRANLVLVCTVQPSVLDDIGANRAMVTRGLLPRILICVPPSNVGYRNRRQASRTNPRVATAYATHLREIADRSKSHPIHLAAGDEAASLFADWDQGLEDELRPGGIYEQQAQFIGKLRANVLRISGLLHVAHDLNRKTDEISVGTMHDAITIGNYFLNERMILQERWGTDEANLHAQAILEWAVRNHRQQFTRRELTHGLRRRFPTNDSTIEPLKRLIETGWMRASGDVSSMSTNSRGTPSLTLTVHPDAEKYLEMQKTTGSVVSVVSVAPKEIFQDSPLPLEKKTSSSGPPEPTDTTAPTDPIRRSGLFDPEE